MSDLGPIHWILGIEVTRDREKRTIALSQRMYIDTIIAQFGMQDAKPVATPMAPKQALSKEDCPKPSSEEWREMRQVPFQSGVGSSMWTLATRPDVAYAVQMLSQFSSNPGRTHWVANKRLLRYLNGMCNLALILSAPNPDEPVIQGWSNADWGADPDECKPITGYAFQLGAGTVTYLLRKQPTQAFSSVESEYMAAGAATQEAMWLRSLLSKLGFAQREPTTIHVDNQGAIALSKNPTHHARVKHIDIRHHFIRDHVRERAVSILWCPMEAQTADVLTKPLDRIAHERHCQGMGLRAI
jgi:hypothetical protein